MARLRSLDASFGGQSFYALRKKTARLRCLGGWPLDVGTVLKNPPHFLRALALRNYRLYFFGQCVSLLGNWMTATASLWLVYHISGSPFDVGLVGFENQIPVLLLSPFAGVWVDRMDGLKLVRLTQVMAMLQSTAMAVFTFSGHMTVPTLVWLCLWQGFINALDFPARQTLTYRLAGERSLLDNVIALNSVTFNLARLVGPAIAGFVIAGFGPGACFTVDAVSYLAVLAALAAARLPPHLPRQRVAHPLDELKDGVRYAWGHPAIRRVLLLVPVIGLVGFAHSILAPVFARDIYLGDARTLGFLLSATGVGSLLAGVFLGGRKSPTGLGRVVTWGAAIGGAGLAGIAANLGLPFALLCFGAAGGGGALVMVTSNTLLQNHVEDDKRGRVMSLFTMGQSFFPLGSLMVGAMAERFGPRPAMCVCGLLCLGDGGGVCRGTTTRLEVSQVATGRRKAWKASLFLVCAPVFARWTQPVRRSLGEGGSYDAAFFPVAGDRKK